MSKPYRIEREQMALGQNVPTYRVIVNLGRGTWGRVQTGLTYQNACDLLDKLMGNERGRTFGGYRR